MALFAVGSGGRNSGLYAWEARTLSSELFPQSSDLFLKLYLWTLEGNIYCIIVYLLILWVLFCQNVFSSKNVSVANVDKAVAFTRL